MLAHLIAQLAHGGSAQHLVSSLIFEKHFFDHSNQFFRAPRRRWGQVDTGFLNDIAAERLDEFALCTKIAVDGRHGNTRLTSDGRDGKVGQSSSCHCLDKALKDLLAGAPCLFLAQWTLIVALLIHNMDYIMNIGIISRCLFMERRTPLSL